MLGTKIQKLRQEKKLTLTQLAQKTDISKSYLSYIERNIQTNPSIEVLVKIASALEVDLQTFLNSNKQGPKSIPNRKVHVTNWSDLINTVLESGLINEEDLQKITLAIQMGKKGDNRKI
jgi:XRE family transcriptional regulator, master regulator for biofilm formation